MTTTSPAAQPVTSAPQPQTRGTLRTRWHRFDVRGMPYLLVAPFFVMFAVFGAFPILYTLYVSLTGWNTRRAGSENTFVGLTNYQNLLGDEFFWNALRNTIGIGILSAVPQLILALWIAHLLNYRLRGRLFFRTGVLVPYVTSVASVALIFNELFARDFGLVNWLLGLVGISPVDWHSGSLASWTAVSVMVVWRWTGYNALIYLAAMQAVPFELYESAAVDGAGRFRQFWSITIPSLRPTIIFTVIVSTIGSLQLFGEPLLFDVSRNAQGGAAREFQTVVLYLYQQFWFNGRYGYASAVAWGLFVFIVLVVGVNLWLSRRIRGEN
ncbi:MAG TPA: sugar ABC transporter permease [Kineosporiaceae bacterium]|nr:sugar ABC transporter permease [Kineosporiaceae bacterium]